MEKRPEAFLNRLKRAVGSFPTGPCRLKRAIGSFPTGLCRRCRQRPAKAGGKKAGGLFKPVEKSQRLFSYRPLPVENSLRLFLTGGIKAPKELLNRLKPAGKALKKPVSRLKRPSAFFCRFLTGFSPAKAGKKGSLDPFPPANADCRQKRVVRLFFAFCKLYFMGFLT